MDQKNDEMKQVTEEFKCNPTGVFSDSLNQSQIGNSHALAKSSLLQKVIALMVVTIIIVVLSIINH